MVEKKKDILQQDNNSLTQKKIQLTHNKHTSYITKTNTAFLVYCPRKSLLTWFDADADGSGDRLADILGDAEGEPV